MATFETPGGLFREDESVAEFRFLVGDTEHVIPREGSLIRRFEQGGGRFDYLQHSTPEGSLVFVPDDEDGEALFERLEDQGFRVEHLAELDERAMQTILDIELSKITSSGS